MGGVAVTASRKAISSACSCCVTFSAVPVVLSHQICMVNLVSKFHIILFTDTLAGRRPIFRVSCCHPQQSASAARERLQRAITRPGRGLLTSHSYQAGCKRLHRSAGLVERSDPRWQTAVLRQYPAPGMTFYLPSQGSTILSKARLGGSKKRITLYGVD